MVTLTRWLYTDDPRFESLENEIIECFRLLPEKTAVAEMLLEELDTHE